MLCQVGNHEPKQCYATEDEALTLAFRRVFSPLNPETNNLHVYLCPTCGKWHITKKYQSGHSSRAVYAVR